MVIGCDLHRPPACGGQVSSGQLSHQRPNRVEAKASKGYRTLQPNQHDGISLYRLKR